MKQHRLVRHLDLFSGIGGFALAAQMVGEIETIGFSEIEPFACRVLAKNFPSVTNYGDIANVRNLPAELVTGGFPCQPFSHAGKQRGAEDDRHLWPEMLRVIGESRPRWVLGENVPGIINMELDHVLADLESVGYEAWPIVIPACAVDATHRRDRVWIIGHADKDGESDVSIYEQMAELQNVGKSNGERWDGRSGERPRREVGGDSRPVRWKPEPGVGRVAHGIPSRMDRLRGLGNAIVPQVAAEVLRCMMRIEFLAITPSSGIAADTIRELVSRLSNNPDQRHDP